jgi:formylmethanofuran dehydrogenase subunit E
MVLLTIVRTAPIAYMGLHHSSFYTHKLRLQWVHEWNRALCNSVNGHMKYHAHKNNLIVLCHECDRDITLEKQHYHDDVPYCGGCYEELEMENPDD